MSENWASCIGEYLLLGGILIWCFVFGRLFIIVIYEIHISSSILPYLLVMYILLSYDLISSMVFCAILTIVSDVNIFLCIIYASFCRKK